MWDPDTHTRTLRWIILRNLDYMHTIASRRRSRSHSLSLSTGKYRAQDNGKYAHQSNQNPRHCYIFSLFVFVYVYIRREYLKWGIGFEDIEEALFIYRQTEADHSVRGPHQPCATSANHSASLFDTRLRWRRCPHD